MPLSNCVTPVMIILAAIIGSAAAGITAKSGRSPWCRWLPGAPRDGHRMQTLVVSLAGLDVKPGDIHYLAISHVHPDHVGNVEEFPGATLISQKAEWEYGFKLPLKPFRPDHKTQLIDGDKDLFGDGSLTILSTPDQGKVNGTPITARPPPEDWLCRPIGRRHAFSGKLRASTRARFQYRQGAVGGSMEKIAWVILNKHAEW